VRGLEGHVLRGVVVVAVAAAIAVVGAIQQDQAVGGDVDAGLRVCQHGQVKATVMGGCVVQKTSCVDTQMTRNEFAVRRCYELPLSCMTVTWPASAQDARVHYGVWADFTVWDVQQVANVPCRADCGLTS